MNPNNLNNDKLYTEQNVEELTDHLRKQVEKLENEAQLLYLQKLTSATEYVALKARLEKAEAVVDFVRKNMVSSARLLVDEIDEIYGHTTDHGLSAEVSMLSKVMPHQLHGEIGVDPIQPKEPLD